MKRVRRKKKEKKELTSNESYFIAENIIYRLVRMEGNMAVGENHNPIHMGISMEIKIHKSHCKFLKKTSLTHKVYDFIVRRKEYVKSVQYENVLSDKQFNNRKLALFELELVQKLISKHIIK